MFKVNHKDTRVFMKAIFILLELISKNDLIPDCNCSSLASVIYRKYRIKRSRMSHLEEFCAPPTPARLGVLSVRKDNVSELQNDETGEFESGNLAVLTGEVVEAQKYQTNELYTKQEQLSKLQNEKQEHQQIFEVVQNELQFANRQLYILQNESTEKRKSCAALQCEIMELINKQHRAKKKLCSLIWNGKSLQETYSKYFSKMENYRELMDKTQRESKVFEELTRIEADIAKTNQEIEKVKENIGSIPSFTQNIKTVRKNHSILLDTVTSLEQQIESERGLVMMLQKEIDAIYKRNAAHVTRTKRQLSVVKQRVSQWKMDIGELRKRITKSK